MLERCREDLESWKIPQKIVILNKFPLNKHGKINRKILHHTPTVTLNIPVDLATWFTDLWVKILKKSPGFEDNFIRSGGDSFLAVLLYNTMVQRIHSLHPTFLQDILSSTFGVLCDTIAQSQFSSKSVTLLKSERVRKADIIPKNDGKLSFEENRVKKAKLDNPKETHEHVQNEIYRLKGRESCIRSSSSSSNSTPVKFRENWRIDFEKCIDSSPLLIRVGEKDRVVVGSHSGWIKCIQVEDGTVLWATR